MKTSQTIINQRTLLGDDYLSIWIDAFIKERTAQNLAKGTITFYRNKLKVFENYLDSQEIKFISQITPNVIRDFLLLQEEGGHTAGGVHAFFRTVKTFLKWYWEETEQTERNPIVRVKAPKVPIEPIQGVTREDFEALVDACPKNTFYGERDRTILNVLLDTGVRASELCNINLDDINLADSSMLIRQGKGKKPRFVFYGKKTRKQLRKWLSFRGMDGSSLFTNKEGDRIAYTTLREIMRRLSRKADIKEPSLHGFRRTFCLECLRKGMSEITIARLMGHTTTQLIGRYAKQTSADLQQAYKSPIDD